MGHRAICWLAMAGLVLVARPMRGQADWTVHRQGLPLRIAFGGVYSPQGAFLSQAGLAQSLWTHRLPNARVDSLWFIAGNGDEFFRYTDLVVHEHRPADQVRTLNWGLREWANLFDRLDQYDVLAFQGLPQVWQQADDAHRAFPVGTSGGLSAKKNRAWRATPYYIPCSPNAKAPCGNLTHSIRPGSCCIVGGGCWTAGPDCPAART